MKRGAYSITTDPARIDVGALHALLQKSYWANERPKAVVAKTLKHSLCFGVLRERELVGFARVITDYATYAYLCDVIIDERFRGKGLGKWLVECVMESKELKSVKSWMLMTADAHGLYRKFGFTEVTDPEKLMRKRRAASSISAVTKISLKNSGNPLYWGGRQRQTRRKPGAQSRDPGAEGRRAAES